MTLGLAKGTPDQARGTVNVDLGDGQPIPARVAGWTTLPASLPTAGVAGYVIAVGPDRCFLPLAPTSSGPFPA
jgi:hypothetical protein